ncbi:MAG TPA: hypothetical protein VGK19_24135 [Capsulimonadaceae bacterium]|jgi:hypothetical protein
MIKLFKLILCGIAASLIFAMSVPVGAATFDKSNVVKIARAFAEATGEKLDEPLTVASPVKSGGASRHHWGPLWTATTATKTVLEVSEITGNVVGYFKLPHVLPGAPPKQTTAPEAIAIASAFVGSTGQKSEISDFPVVAQKAQGDLAKGFPACLLVSWRRTFHGIPYYYDNVNVLVDASTAKVLRFAVNFHAAAPSTVTEAITAQEAVKIADLAIQEIAFTKDLVPLPPRKAVTQVSGKPTMTFSGRSDKGKERVVWACPFLTPSKKTYEAWVDIENGNVVGGVVADVLETL